MEHDRSSVYNSKEFQGITDTAGLNPVWQWVVLQNKGSYNKCQLEKCPITQSHLQRSCLPFMSGATGVGDALYPKQTFTESGRIKELNNKKKKKA